MGNRSSKLAFKVVLLAQVLLLFHIELRLRKSKRRRSQRGFGLQALAQWRRDAGDREGAQGAERRLMLRQCLRSG